MTENLEGRGQEDLLMTGINNADLRISSSLQAATLTTSKARYPSYYSDNLNVDWSYRMPDMLEEKLPGSRIGAKRFLAELKVDDFHAENRLKAGEGSFETAFVYESADSKFSLNVLGNASQDAAQDLAKLASANEYFNDQRARAYYQQLLFDVMLPVFSKMNSRGSKLNITAGCMATGAEMMGLLALLKTQRSSLLPTTAEPISINLAVATTTSILILKRFAEQNDFNLHLNVGYLEFELTDLKQRDGSTYVVSDLEQEFIPWQYEKALAVGDMRSASQPLTASHLITDPLSCPWNDKNTVESTWRDPQLITNIYLGGTGNLLRAFWRHLSNTHPKAMEQNEILVAAEKIPTKKMPSFVIFTDLPSELEDTFANPNLQYPHWMHAHRQLAAVSYN